MTALIGTAMIGGYDGSDILKGCTIKVESGEIAVIVGPNGAGKSTFINIMAGTVVKTAGSLSVWGTDIDADPRQARSNIGIVPQELNIDAYFTPRQTLEMTAGLFGVPKDERRTDQFLEMVGLTEQAHTYARRLSGGMRRRLLVAKAMVHSPPILVLDEPTAGVDVELRKNLWENVKQLNKIGVTIILTTHYLFEAQEMCDRIAIINKGNLVALDTTKKLLDRIKTKKITFKLKEFSSDLSLNLPKVKFLIEANNTIIVNYEKKSINFEQLINYLKEKNLKILDISIDEGDLEDVFIQLTKK